MKAEFDKHGTLWIVAENFTEQYALAHFKQNLDKRIGGERAADEELGLQSTIGFLVNIDGE